MIEQPDLGWTSRSKHCVLIAKGAHLPHRRQDRSDRGHSAGSSPSPSDHDGVASPEARSDARRCRRCSGSSGTGIAAEVSAAFNRR